ncbi:MAG: glycosyltransferase family 39 protein [Bryobacterales bacterium]|nr:glycosyltransferase family 39 protein [Bryobacterales bacterium]
MWRILTVVFLLTLGLKLCHSDVVWVEEAYPIAAALEMLRGKTLYRDIWFDKPPLFAAYYWLLGASIGWKLRLAGALLVTASSACAWLLARRLWSEREATLAAALIAFFLNFGIPAAVMAAAPDQLMIPFHLLAIFFCVRNQPLPAGAACGLALLVNPKAPFVFLACLAWQWRKIHWLAAGAAAVQLPALAILDWRAYFDQVWTWGMIYSRDTFVAKPFAEALQRTLNWAGFQAALVAGAALAIWRQRDPQTRRLLLWTIVSFAAVCAGLRFFPRYYFHLLVPVIILASRGLAPLRRPHILALALLLIPLVRFAPRYVQVATGTPWSDLALHDDARQAAAFVRQHPNSSIFVWGYRPEVYAYSQAPAATPWLDSQPLTGVMADRHLFSSEPSTPSIGALNRARLTSYQPEIILDGLGPLNPALAITNYPELKPWLDHYRLAWSNRSFQAYLRRQH